MPAFRENDPRHPTNRCHTMYVAALEAVGTGVRITQDQWRSMVKLATGVIVGRQVEDYTQTMEDLLMVKRHGRDGIELLEGGLALIALSESSDTPEPTWPPSLDPARMVFPLTGPHPAP